MIAGILLCLAHGANAKLTLSALISDNMVLQQGQPDLIWGWDEPGAKVEVSMGQQKKSATADKSGRWSLQLDAMPANATPQTMTVKGTSAIEVKNILVGEVWLCSGQSNMAMTMHEVSNADVEIASMNYPNIRFIDVPNWGVQEPTTNFEGQWKACTPEAVHDASALALFYGRYLHQALGVPVGLVHNAWGGTNIEAWLPRPLVANNPQFADIMALVKRAEDRAASPKALARYEQQKVDYEKDLEEAAKQGLPRPHRPHDPRDYLVGNSRPGNAYNGVQVPVIGYGIKGVIWYQGESNTEEAMFYERLFTLLIGQWRKDWNNPNLPCYWVQLPARGDRDPEPTDGWWSWLREAQSKVMNLPHTGQAVTIDIGEPENLHPRNKLDVAARLARWALVKEYGKEMPFRSPEFKSSAPKDGGKMEVTFDFIGHGLCTHGPDAVNGFALCGADHKSHWAKGEQTGPNTVEVSCDKVPKPMAIRYGWSDNPDCNLFTLDGLPATPFRTDNFEVVVPEPPPAAK